nr:MAG TPA: hypothetical protein [Bacteriophage sp.]
MHLLHKLGVSFYSPFAFHRIFSLPMPLLYASFGWKSTVFGEIF